MKNKSGWRKLDKKKGLNNPDKVFIVNPKEDPDVPSKPSSSLTSRAVNPGKIKTYMPVQEPQPVPTNILSSRTTTWPPEKTKMDLTVRKEVWPPVKSHSKGEPYHCDEQRYNALCRIYNRIVGNYQAMLDAYSQLGIKRPVDRMKLGQLAFEDLSSIRTDFYTLIEEDIEKLNLKTDLVRSTFDVPATQRYAKFEQSIMSQRNLIQSTLQHESFQHSFELNYLTLQGDNTIVFTDRNKEDIRDNCSTFIDSQAKKDFIKLLAQVESDFDALRNMLSKNGINKIFGYGHLISINDQKISINKSIVNFINK